MAFSRPTTLALIIHTVLPSSYAQERCLPLFRSLTGREKPILTVSGYAVLTSKPGGCHRTRIVRINILTLSHRQPCDSAFTTLNAMPAAQEGIQMFPIFRFVQLVLSCIRSYPSHTAVPTVPAKDCGNDPIYLTPGQPIMHHACTIDQASSFTLNRVYIKSSCICQCPIVLSSPTKLTLF